MTLVAENIKLTTQRIRDLEKRYARPPGAVQIMAVSKQQPAEKIRQAHEAGLRHFGENYLQEALSKKQALEGLDCQWHFIGPIQSNKTRGIAEHFDWVHSVDRERIARRLSDQRPHNLPALNICVQVNISGESSKSGVAPAQSEALCQAISELPGLTLRGLMSIPAPVADFQAQRDTFRKLAQLFAQLKARYSDFDTLSMGMSADYEAAIAEGATLVRLGTVLFGPRQ